MPTDLAVVEVEVRGEDLVVTLPGTSFMVAYYKPVDRLDLITRSNWMDDPSAAMTLGEFRAKSRIAAERKARDLGWLD